MDAPSNKYSKTSISKILISPSVCLAMTHPCPVCNSPSSSDKSSGKCSICNRDVEVYICRNGHGICDACMDECIFQDIIKCCLGSTSDDPYDIFMEIMGLDSVRMHDYKHHVIVGSALLTANRNAGANVNLELQLKEMLKRGRKVPPGSCGYMGNCGAAVSVGIFLSILTNTTPYSESTWGDVNLATAQALIQMGIIGGPRCCKRNSLIAIKVGSEIAAEKFGSQMKLGSEMKCQMSSRNGECIKERCPYYVNQ